MKLRNIITTLALTAMFSSLQATVYENAEDGSSARWTVYDATPAGASVENIVDNTRGSRVIQLTPGVGEGSNGYMIGAIAGAGKWSNTSERNIKWSMKFTQYYTIYISLETANGQRYLKYTPINHDLGDLGNGYFHFGLGSNSDAGQWVDMVRDLDADLALVEPDNSVLAVNGFLVRGTGLIDDLELLDNKPVLNDITYEDAEDGSTDGWIVYDATPEGATINNVVDSERNGKVIELSGTATQNGYMFGNWLGRAGAWAELDRKTITWDMKYSEYHSFFITVQTDNGRRYMYYNSTNQDRGIVNEVYIHHGLGTSYMDGKWHTVSVNLEKDLQEYEPDNHITSVNGILIRGSGKIDNIILSDGIPTLPDTVYEDAEVGLADWITAAGEKSIGRHEPGFESEGLIGFHATWKKLDNGYWQNLSEYRLAVNNRTQKVLSLQTKYASRAGHYAFGVRVSTTLGVRRVIWTHFYNHSNIKANIRYYGSTAFITFPEPDIAIGPMNVAEEKKWRDYDLNIEEAIRQFEPNNILLSVDYLITTGGDFDNILLK